MPVQRAFNLAGLNLYVNPLLKGDGELIQALNVESYPFGAKSKRPGYTAFLGTANGSAVTNLWSWTKNNGSLTVYRESGGIIYHSVEGTGAWTISPNGTVTAGNYIGYDVLDDTMVICDGAGSTRHTTDGTSFTNTTLAPVAVDIVQYQNRIYALGTSSDNFYSVTNDATNWATTGTSDSSSFKVPGGGKLLKGFVAGDRLVLNKTSGKQFKWDGYSLVDTGTKLAVTSPWSVDQAEGYYFYLNRLGVFGHGGAKPQLLSNAVQSQIYNSAGSGVAGTTFDNAGGGVHRYNYYVSVGTTTDDYADITISNNIINYNYQTNEFLNWQFAHKPNVFHSFVNASGVETFIFGGANGQVYQLSGTATSDAGNPIYSVLEFVIHGGVPDRDKLWKNIKMFFNPGCNAKVQLALSDHYVKGDNNKKWFDARDVKTGTFEHTFSGNNTRGKFLYVKIYESSSTSKWTFYGYTYNADVIGNE